MSKETDFSHLNDNGQARMVDVGNKEPTLRTARAEAIVNLGEKIAAQLRETGSISKGNVIETARIAGITAAKKTSDLIPMCHPLPLDVVEINIEVNDSELRIESFAKCQARTGVEMEAMTAATVATLTVYDMCKSAEKGIAIEHIRLLEKTGGKSGDYKAPDNP